MVKVGVCDMKLLDVILYQLCQFSFPKDMIIPQAGTRRLLIILMRNLCAFLLVLPFPQGRSVIFPVSSLFENFRLVWDEVWQG